MLALAGQPHSLMPMQMDATKYHCISPEAAADVSSEDSGQALPCLPRRTVVLISGNNRTKKSLVGKQAIVKRCVGLGGWHHCVSAVDQGGFLLAPGPWHPQCLLEAAEC